MSVDEIVSRALVKGSSGSLEQFLGGRPVDLLFVSKAGDYKAVLSEFLRLRAVNVQNVAQVYYDLYPSGGEGPVPIPDYEKQRGVHHAFGIGVSDTGHYFFSGDELNPENALIIVNEFIQYGRAFRQVCKVLQSFMGRNFESGSAPPTFAFFKKLQPNLNGIFGLDGNNVFVPVGSPRGPNFLPFLTEY